MAKQEGTTGWQPPSDEEIERLRNVYEEQLDMEETARVAQALVGGEQVAVGSDNSVELADIRVLPPEAAELGITQAQWHSAHDLWENGTLSFLQALTRRVGRGKASMYEKKTKRGSSNSSANESQSELPGVSSELPPERHYHSAEQRRVRREEVAALMREGLSSGDFEAFRQNPEIIARAKELGLDLSQPPRELS